MSEPEADFNLAAFRDAVLSMPDHEPRGPLYLFLYPAQWKRYRAEGFIERRSDGGTYLASTHGPDSVRCLLIRPLPNGLV